MPRKPMHPCNHVGCSNLTRERYCEDHKGEAYKRYEQTRRDPQTAKRYGNEWRKVRAAYIRMHPICEQCEKNGKVVPVEEVHHILTLAEGGTHDFENLMSLCKSCHSAITAKEWSRGGRGSENL